MSEQYKIFEPDAPYFTTFTLVEWLPLFAIREFAAIMTESIQYCIDNKGLLLFGYCIMPSHVHLIVQSHTHPLGSTFRDMKKYTSSQLIDSIRKNENYPDYLSIFRDKAAEIKRNKFMKVWLDGYHPEIIYSNSFFFQKLNYIHNNPVVAGLVKEPEDYYYSSARNYAGLDAPLEIVFESMQLSRY
jgi:REP element-mobilizing transposase RayT